MYARLSSALAMRVHMHQAWKNMQHPWSDTFSTRVPVSAHQYHPVVAWEVETSGFGPSAQVDKSVVRE